MEIKNRIPKQQDYLTIIDKTIIDYYSKIEPILINSKPAPVRFVNASRLDLWIRNVENPSGVGKNKGDLPLPCILINREENGEIFSNWNGPRVGNAYSRIMVEYEKKKSGDTISNVDSKVVKEFVWIKKPKPIKASYGITCYSKFNLDINEFHTEMLNRMNATNIVLPNVPNNLDLRFIFDNKISNKDLKNVNTERYMLCTFMLNVDGFVFDLNDLWRDTGIENVTVKFEESDNYEFYNEKDKIKDVTIDWSTGSRQSIY